MIKNIGFIGVGIMGKPMVRNLMRAGYELTIYARTQSRVQDVIEEGAVFRESVAECVKGQDVVVTMVGFPKDVEEIYFGKEGILENAGQGTYLIDMTTTSPELEGRIAETAKERGLHFLDAPVTGGDFGAKSGTLSILVGGEKKAYEYCMPVFEVLGNNIEYFGRAGMGQHAKLANQIVIAGTLGSVCEAMAYAEKEGIDLHALFQAISGGAAGSTQMTKVAALALEDNYNPGFLIKHFIKDMKLADEEAGRMNLALPILDEVLHMYLELQAEGKDNLGTQSLIQLYREKQEDR